MNLLTANTDNGTAHNRHSTGNARIDRLPHRRPRRSTVPLLDQIRRFLSSPQGRRLTDRGRRYASDPRNQQRARDVVSRWRRRR